MQSSTPTTVSSVGEQLAKPGSRANANLVAARFLLKPGRRYEDAVKTFEPYDRVKKENSEARTAAKASIEEGKVAGHSKVKNAECRMQNQGEGETGSRARRLCL